MAALLPLLAWVGSLLGSPQAAADPSDRPHVLVLMLDDFGLEDVRGVALPNLDELRSAGRNYTRFVSSSTSSPARYQLHFGRYPHRAFIGGELDPVADAGAPTSDLSIAERLSVAGYHTALFGGWQVNGAALPIRVRAAGRVHGYERWRAGSPEGLEAVGQSHYAWFRMDDGKGKTSKVYTTTAIVDELIGWWQASDQARFAVAAFLAPAAPYDAPPANLLPTPLANDAGPRERYVAALQALDSEVGRLLASIDTENTWVLLVGDNGTPADVAPPNGTSAGYAPSLYQGGVRAPLVVWGPGVQPGVDESLVQMVDLPATVLELLGVEAPVGFEDSISFAPTLVGAPGSRPYAWLQHFAPNSGDAPSVTLDEWAVLRADGWKLLGDANGTRLFDLDSDPGESAPVDAPQIEAELLELRAEALGTSWPY